MAELTDWAKRSMEGRPTEATITRKVIKALTDGGYTITHVFDGGERVPVEGKNAILNEVFNLDECYLIAANNSPCAEFATSWVRLVMGNEYDIVCDYTTDLEQILQPVSDWCAEREAA